MNNVNDDDLRKRVENIDDTTNNGTNETEDSVIITPYDEDSSFVDTPKKEHKIHLTLPFFLIAISYSIVLLIKSIQNSVLFLKTHRGPDTDHRNFELVLNAMFTLYFLASFMLMIFGVLKWRTKKTDSLMKLRKALMIKLIPLFVVLVMNRSFGSLGFVAPFFSTDVLVLSLVNLKIRNISVQKVEDDTDLIALRKL